MTIFFALVTYLGGDTIEIICIQIYILDYLEKIQWLTSNYISRNKSEAD